jgi:hypothetical protein
VPPSQAQAEMSVPYVFRGVDGDSGEAARSGTRAAREERGWTADGAADGGAGDYPEDRADA